VDPHAGRRDGSALDVRCSSRNAEMVVKRYGYPARFDSFSSASAGLVVDRRDGAVARRAGDIRNRRIGADGRPPLLNSAPWCRRRQGAGEVLGKRTMRAAELGEREYKRKRSAHPRRWQGSAGHQSRKLPQLLNVVTGERAWSVPAKSRTRSSVMARPVPRLPAPAVPASPANGRSSDRNEIEYAPRAARSGLLRPLVVGGSEYDPVEDGEGGAPDEGAR